MSPTVIDEARLHYAESQGRVQARRAGDERAAKHWKKQIKHLSRELSGGGNPHGSAHGASAFMPPGGPSFGPPPSAYAPPMPANAPPGYAQQFYPPTALSPGSLSSGRLSDGRLSGWLPLQRLPANGRSKRRISIWDRRFSLRRSRRRRTDGFGGRPWRAARSADGWRRCAFCGALGGYPQGSKRAISVWRSRRGRADGLGGRSEGALLGPLLRGELFIP